MSKRFAIDELPDVSREFARLFLARFPDLQPSCSRESIEGVPGLHLLIRIKSPAGTDRDVTIWMEMGDEPSLAFGEGGWHTHFSNTRQVGPNDYQEESLLDLLAAIFEDQVVIFEEPGDKPKAIDSVLDLRDPDALIEEFTTPDCTDRVRIKTFTGHGDREVELASFRN